MTARTIDKRSDDKVAAARDDDDDDERYYGGDGDAGTAAAPYSCGVIRLARSMSCGRKRPSSSPPSSSASVLPPRGHMAVYVGPERQRFVIKTAYLNHPIFRAILRKMEDQLGLLDGHHILHANHCSNNRSNSCNINGGGGGGGAAGLSIPFEPVFFEHLLRHLQAPSAGPQHRQYPLELPLQHLDDLFDFYFTDLSLSSKYSGPCENLRGPKLSHPLSP